MKTTTIVGLLLLVITPLVAQDFHRYRVMLLQKSGWIFLEETLTETTMVDRQMTLVDSAQQLYTTRKVQVLKTTDPEGADIVYYDLQISCLHKTYMLTEARGYDLLDKYVYTKEDLEHLGFMPVGALENEWFCNMIAGEP